MTDLKHTECVRLVWGVRNTLWLDLLENPSALPPEVLFSPA